MLFLLLIDGLIGFFSGAVFAALFAPLLICVVYPKLCKAGHFGDVYIAVLSSLLVNGAFRKEVGVRLDAIEHGNLKV